MFINSKGDLWDLICKTNITIIYHVCISELGAEVVIVINW